MPLYEELQSGGQAVRQEAATRIVSGMQASEDSANMTFWGVAQRVIAEQGAQEAPGDASLPQWEFPAENSALLVVRYPRRVTGFLKAIARVPQAESVIDAGCGSTALLAIGAAVTHPRAQVMAYEINDPAARCAQSMVELFGLSDRITVTQADTLTADFPEVDLAVTETFDLGLLTEQGHLITERLAHTSKEILPDHAVIHGCDERPTAQTFWRPAAVVNFRLANERVEGHVPSKGEGTRPISVYTGFYDARNVPILTETGTNLTNPVHLGTIAVPAPDMRIGFSYALGAQLHENPARLWVEPR